MPTFVQTAKSPDTNDGTLTTVALAAFGSNPTAGNCIVGHFSAQVSGSLSTVTDNASGGSNTYTVIDSMTIDAPNGIRLFTFVGQNIKANATPLTITGTFSAGAQYRRGSAQEFSGAATTGQPHKNIINASAAFGTGTDAVTSTAQTTTIDGCTIWGVAYDDSTATLPSAGTGFTSRDSAPFGAGDGWRVEEKLQATAGSVAATFTTSAGTDLIGVAMLAIAPSSGGASTTNDGLLSLSRNRPGRGPYSLGRYFRPIGETARAITVASHAASGDLAAGASSVAGAAVHPHTTTGALAAQAASVAGSAAHLTLHATSGVLVAGNSTVTGAAVRAHNSSGVLASGASAVSGAATHLTLHAASGALAAGDSSVAGVAAAPFIASGVLSADNSTVAGAASHLTLHDSSGALAADAATVVGSASLTSVGHTTTGSLSVEAAAVVGAAMRFALHTTSGSLAAGPSTVAGSAARAATHDASGDLVASGSSVSGDSFHDAGGASAAAVWSYILSNGKSAGQNLVENNAMLLALTSAIEGPYTIFDLIRIIAAVAAGETRITNLGGGNAHVEFDAVDQSEVRVAAEMTGSERTDVTLTP